MVIFLAIIGVVVLRVKIRQTCQKRRERQARENVMMMMQPPPPAHVLAQRTASGASVRTTSSIGTPGFGPGQSTRPYMAGPTVMNPSRRLILLARPPSHRSDMPPPYSEVPRENENRMEGGGNAAPAVTSAGANQETSFTTADNPGYVPDEDQSQRLASSDNEDDAVVVANPYTIDDTSLANVVSQGSLMVIDNVDESLSPAPSAAQGAEAMTHGTDSIGGYPAQQAQGGDSENPGSEKAEAQNEDSQNADSSCVTIPVNDPVIDNYDVDVSARDTIQTIDNLIVDDTTVTSGADFDTNDEVIYL